MEGVAGPPVERRITQALGTTMPKVTGGSQSDGPITPLQRTWRPLASCPPKFRGANSEQPPPLADWIW
jgi:hypothetical protein